MQVTNPGHQWAWLSALRETLTITPSEIRLVTIADREADIFEFLAEADELVPDYPSFRRYR